MTSGNRRNSRFGFLALVLAFIVQATVATTALADPNTGPGGPILVVTSSGSTFSKFYAEILRAEGLNEFAVADVSTVTSTTLNSYDVVILANATLTSTQVTAFTNWVNAGGNLIAMDPNSQLASLLGIAVSSSTISNGYLAVDKTTASGNGIAAGTMQYHGAAKLITLNGAASLATLYSSATASTGASAITLNSVGSNGGQAAAFAFDLAKSIVYTRQGNPAWATQERDSLAPVRSNDKFFGGAAGDSQPDWVDLNKVAIPQADEQQRLLANLITHMARDRKPLPRFWYLPNGNRAAIVMTGDDHNNAGTLGRFNQFIAASPAGCNLANWECVRGTSYVFNQTPISDAQMAAFNAQGFEISVHINTQCTDYTQASLADNYTTQLAEFHAVWPSLPNPVTERHHCIVWSDWASGAKVQFANGIRLDTTYYYWPAAWVNNHPGNFTGSAMPMRFADLDGTLIDVYQVASQMTDESGQEYPFTVDTLLDRALGDSEQYGVYTINAHTDVATIIESTATVASAQARGVPIVSARQMLTWLDGRNNSSFGSIAYSGNNLTFTVTQATGATGLRGLVPRRSRNGLLNTIRRGASTDVSYEVVTIKGVEYASFSALSGSYTAAYVADTAAPTVIGRSPASGATGVAIAAPVTVTFNESMDPSTITGATFELRTAANVLVSSAVSYDAASKTARLVPTNPLAYGTSYTARLRGGASDPRVKDAQGNAIAADIVWTFTTLSGDGCPCSVWTPATVPGTAAVVDPSGVTLGVKFQSTVNGVISGVRFYKGSTNTGTHVGSLWTAAGVQLATATFENETATGWQTVTFAAPVSITAGTVYVASYFAPAGNYAADGAYFASAVQNGSIRFLSSAESGGNGVYAYGFSNTFPSGSYNSTNYWVDVLFSTVPPTGTDTVAPTVTITGPTSATTFSTTTNPLLVAGTSADAVGVTRINWTNSRGGSGIAEGTTSWAIPSLALAPGSNLITVTAVDAAGNSSSDSITITLSPDVTAPTISTRTPAAAATNVNVDSQVSVTFNEPLDPTTVSTSSVELRAGSTVIPASVAYSAASYVVTLTPSTSLSPSTVYTVNVRGGSTDPRIKDLAGNALAATASWTFTTSSNICPCTIWNGAATPLYASEADTDAVEVGVKFRTTTTGNVTGARFYKGSANTGTHTAHLWTADGTLLATAAFGGETSFGWQQVSFPAPVTVQADTTYVISYHAPNGHYASDPGYFASSPTSRGPLTALADGTDGVNGVFSYGPTGTFPTSSWNASNYWVDVVFAGSNAAPDTTAPTISARSPASGATGVSTGGVVSVTFNEALQAASVTSTNVQLRIGSTVVSSTLSYNAGAFVATLVPTNTLNASTTYNVIVRGGSTGIKDASGNSLVADSTWSFTTGTGNTNCNLNAITAENCLTGNIADEWDVSGAGDFTIQGFATQISVNRGSAIQFKVDTDATSYHLDIYRMGYYNGRGARKITTINPSASLPQNQPECIVQASTGLIDCGLWSVSASWTVPSTAVSGIYFAKLVRDDTGGASHIMFVVRNDAGVADVVFQTSDTTWQAYNNYGGNSLYQGSPGTNPSRAYKVSYNRPFNTRAVDGGQDWVFNSEYPMVRFLESNGYNVTYISGLDTDRNVNLVTSRKVFLSVGHDEYWSGQQRTNIEAARAAGVHLAFFSGNEMFWKTRWENSIDGSNTANRTLVSYKETHANAKLDPSALWTGTWRDPRFSPPSDGGRPENAVTGQSFAVNAGTAAINVTAADGKMRFWRNTTVAALSSGSVQLADSTLGYEWDTFPKDAARPAGAFGLSTTTVSGVEAIQDFGSTYAPDTVTHSLSLYRASSGALVFGAGTVQWPWGLDSTHDRGSAPADLRMQQATVNLFADMNVQPATLRPNLVAASLSSDATRPVSVIATPAAGSSFEAGEQVTITGTATDVGGVVAGIEVSTDNGTTWRSATGRASWTYTWIVSGTGSTTIKTRAIDDSGNIEVAGAGRSVTITTPSTSCPCTLWPASATPSVAADGDTASVELGVKFRSDVAGRITGIRFYKGTGNSGTHVAHLWSNAGALLATATFQSETASGWQQVNFTTPVNITANTVYVASYLAPAGHYAADSGYFANGGFDRGPLHALQDGTNGGNGVYLYTSTGGFPNASWQATNYWVDVVFATP
jgi:hypothetical protein